MIFSYQEKKIRKVKMRIYHTSAMKYTTCKSSQLLFLYMRSAKNLVTEVEKAPNIMVENMNVYIKAEIRNGICVCE